MALDIDNHAANGVVLEVNSDQQDSTFLINYQVTNQLAETVYLLNRIFQWTEAGLEIEADFIYTEVKNGQLRLTKAFIPVPDDVLAEMPDVPYLTAVESGAVFTEQVRLTIPLEPFHPYDKVGYSDNQHTFEEAELVIGWLVEGSFDLRQGSTPDGDDILAVHHSQAAQAQRLLKGAINRPITAAFGP